MWRTKTVFLVLMFLPSLASAKEFTLPSGLVVNIPDSEITYYQKEWKEFVLPSGLHWFAESIIHTPTAQASELNQEDMIRLYIVKIAQEYGVDSDYMLQLAACESNMNPEAYNPTDPQGGAKGLFQYLQPTWNKWQKESGIKGDIWNYRSQVYMTAYALSKGRQLAWKNCNYYILTGTWPK